MGKRMAAFLAAITLGLGAGAAAAEEFVVAVRQIADLKAVFATVESVDVTPARTRIGGTVEALAVDEGSRVELGQQLAVVGDPKLPLQLVALDARIRSLGAQRELARIELERARTLRQSGTVSQARLDEARTALDVVDSGLAAMTAERAVVAEQLAEGAVLAPAAGRVLQVNVVDGAVVMPGETVATIAAETYILRMRLPERHARFIAEGDRVLVGSRGLETAPRDLAEGRVRQVYPEMEQGRVVADIAAAGIGDYFVGERARVFVSTGERPAIVVPAAYLYRRFGVDYALVEDGVEVLSGLRPGDVLLPPPAEPAR